MRAPDQCVILVGGLGSRLGALTAECPKPLLPVGGAPFLDVLLWHLQRFGFKKIVLSAGYRAEQVERYAATAGERFDLDVTVVAEPARLGTAGALRHVLPECEDVFLLLNGDSVFDINVLDLVPLLAASSEATMAMALRRKADASRFGVVDLVGDRVTAFLERGTASGGIVNGGVYLVRRDRLPPLPETGSLEQETLPALAAAGAVLGRVYDSFFLDVGVPDSYAVAHRLVPDSMRRPAVFFDRDGVLNVDYGYVGTIERFAWMPTAIDAIKWCNDAGLFVFVVTNQAGVARGFYDEADVDVLHAHMQRELRAQGAHFDAVRFCPYHPDGTVERLKKASDWRKPAPGMILDLLATWPIDRDASLLVGDKPTDMEAARHASVAGMLFAGGDLVEMLKLRLEAVSRPDIGLP